MASPIGTVPAVAGIGYDNQAVAPSQSIFHPAPIQNLSAGTYSTGSVNTASTDTTGTQTLSTFARLTTAQFYMNPYFIANDLTYRQVEAHVSADTVAGTGNVTGGWMYGIYQPTTSWYLTLSGNTEVSSRSYLTNISKFGYNFKLSQNSVTAQSYTLWSGSASNASTASTATNGNISTDFTGARNIQLTSGTATSSLSRGQYFIIHGFTKTSAGANVFSCNHGRFLSATLAQGNYFGSTNLSGLAASVGSFTTGVSSTHSTGTAAVASGVNCLPDSIYASQVSSSVAADVKYAVPNFFY